MPSFEQPSDKPPRPSGFSLHDHDDEGADLLAAPRSSASKNKAKSPTRWLWIAAGSCLHLGAIFILVMILMGKAHVLKFWQSPPEDNPPDIAQVKTTKTPPPRVTPPPATPPADPGTSMPPPPANVATPPAPNLMQWELPVLPPPAGQPSLKIDSAVVSTNPTTPLPAKITPSLLAFEAVHEGPIRAMVLSYDGRYLLSAGDDRKIQVSDGETGKPVRSFDAAAAPIHALALHPEGGAIASGGGDGSIRFWDLSSGRELFNLAGHPVTVKSLAFSPNGLYLLSGSEDGTLRLWDLKAKAEIRQFRLNQPITSVAFGTDGRRSLAGGDHGNVWIHDLESGSVLHAVGGHIGTVNAVRFSPDGRQAVSVGDDKTIRVLDVVTGKKLRTMRFGDPLRVVQHGGDGWLVSAGSGAYALFLPAGEKPPVKLDQAAFVGTSALAMTPESNRFYVGNLQGKIARIDIEPAATAKNPRTPPATPGTNPAVTPPAADPKFLPRWVSDGNAGMLRSLGFSASGKVLVTGGSDRTVRFWDPATGKEQRNYPNLTNQEQNIALSRDGTMVLVGGNSLERVGNITLATDTALRTLAVDNGRLFRLGAHLQPITCVALSANARNALSGGSDRSVRYWDARTARNPRVFLGHLMPVRGVDLSPKGNKAASVAADQTARFWDVASGRGEIKIDLPLPPSSIVFNPDGRTVLISGPRLLGIWDANTGGSVRSFDDFVNPTATPVRRRRIADGNDIPCCWSPNGKSVLIGSSDGVTVVNVMTGKEELHLSGLTAAPQAIAVSGDGRFVVAAGKVLALWQLEKPLAAESEPPSPEPSEPAPPPATPAPAPVPKTGS